MNNDQKRLSAMSHEELWQLFPVILSEYKPGWPEMFKTEKRRLEKLIRKENIFRISHIGSTAVPGLIAKPTVDILLEINPHTDTSQIIRAMETNGYIYSAQPEKPAPHMMFMKGYTARGFEGQTYHVHVRYAGDWDELYFRDYLTIHPETAKEYALLKLRLKKEFEYHRDNYTLGKTDFILRITDLARIEFPDQYKV